MAGAVVQYVKKGLVLGSGSNVRVGFVFLVQYCVGNSDGVYGVMRSVLETMWKVYTMWEQLCVTYVLLLLDSLMSQCYNNSVLFV